MGVKGNTYRKTALLDVFESKRGGGERERSNKTETWADKGLIWERGREREERKGERTKREEKSK